VQFVNYTCPWPLTLTLIVTLMKTHQYNVKVIHLSQKPGNRLLFKLYLHWRLLILFIYFERKYTTIICDLLTVDLDLHCDLADIYLSLGCIILPSCILFMKLYFFEKTAKFDLYDLWLWLKFDLAERYPVYLLYHCTMFYYSWMTHSVYILFSNY
jgi:hypothetical protein